MKYRKLVACLLVGSLAVSASSGMAWAEEALFTSEGTDVVSEEEVTEEVPEGETPEEGIPEEEIHEEDVPEITDEPEVEVEPEEPMADGEVDFGGSEVVEPIEPEIEEPEATPTEVPEEEPERVRDLVINFEGCTYGSNVTVSDENGVVATVRVNGESNEVDYMGETFSVEGDVVLEDYVGTTVLVETEWEQLGSDVISAEVMDAEGNVTFSREDFKYPSSESSVQFTMTELGDTFLTLEFGNLSAFSDLIVEMCYEPYDENDPLFTPLKEMVGGDVGIDEMINNTVPLAEGTELLDSDGTHPVTYSTQEGSSFYAIPDSGKAHITMGRSLTYESSGYNTHEYSVAVGDTTAFGYCAQANKSCPSNTTCNYGLVTGAGLVHPVDKNNLKRNVDVMKLMMLSKPGWDCDEFSKKAFSNVYGKYEETVCYIHACLSYMYEGSTPGLYDGEVQGIQNAIRSADLYMTGYFSDKYPGSEDDKLTQQFRKVVDKYNLYVAKPGSALQDIMFLVVGDSKGYITVKKTSANSAITNNNGNYSLKGAIYTVYSDKNCTKKVGSITTDANGNGRLNDLELNTNYWVKETKASPGYNLDKTVYQVTPKKQ